MSVSDLNAFCRRFDLIYVEEGYERGTPIYWFIDFENHRRYYTKEEIESKMGMLV